MTASFVLSSGGKSLAVLGVDSFYAIACGKNCVVVNAGIFSLVRVRVDENSAVTVYVDKDKVIDKAPVAKGNVLDVGKIGFDVSSKETSFDVHVQVTPVVAKKYVQRASDVGSKKSPSRFIQPVDFSQPLTSTVEVQTASPAQTSTFEIHFLRRATSDTLSVEAM